MTLVPVDLPAPEEINRVLAAHAAVYAMLGKDDDFVFADGNERQSGSGSGDDWARLALLPGGRAVIYGMEQSDARFTWLDNQEERNPVDLLDGAPDWWREAVKFTVPLTFIYGYEDGQWLKVQHDLEDGFDNVIFCKTDEELASLLSEELFELPTDDPALLTVIRAGAAVTEHQLQALIDAVQHMLEEDEGEPVDPEDWFDELPDVAAGAIKARSFALSKNSSEQP